MQKHFDMPLDIKKKLFSFMRIFIFFHIKYLKKMCKIYEVEIFFRILNSIQKKLHFNSYIGKDTCKRSTDYKININPHLIQNLPQDISSKFL